MRALRLLLFSDEVSLMGDAARQHLKGYEYQVFDETDVTEAGARRQLAHGIEIDVISAEEIEGAITRRGQLGRTYDAYALYSLRVWRIGHTLLSWVRMIREHPYVADSGLRQSSLPIAVMNPLNVVDSRDPRSAELGELLNMEHVSAAQRGESFADCVIRVIADWHTDLLGQLEYLGYAIALDERGVWEVDAAFRRPDRDSKFFGSPPKLSVLCSSNVFRVTRNVLLIEEALKGLETALNEAHRLPAKQREPRLQRCLEDHPELLTQGLFDTLWAEPRLPTADPLRRDIRPDFIAAGSPDWDHVLRPRIYEIKSPEFRVAVARKATQELLMGLEQLGDRYRRYFDDIRNQPIQRKRLGRVIEHPRLMLVIGRDRWTQDWLDLEELQRSSEHDSVSIVSYDELEALNTRRLGVLRRLMFRASR
jgi:hypothetical protein